MSRMDGCTERFFKFMKMANPNKKPRKQMMRPMSKSVCPSKPRNVTRARSGSTRLASLPTSCACACGAGPLPRASGGSTACCASAADETRKIAAHAATVKAVRRSAAARRTKPCDNKFKPNMSIFCNFTIERFLSLTPVIGKQNGDRTSGRRVDTRERTGGALSPRLIQPVSKSRLKASIIADFVLTCLSGSVCSTGRLRKRLLNRHSRAPPRRPTTNRVADDDDGCDHQDRSQRRIDIALRRGAGVGRERPEDVCDRVPTGDERGCADEGERHKRRPTVTRAPHVDDDRRGDAERNGRE